MNFLNAIKKPGCNDTESVICKLINLFILILRLTAYANPIIFPFEELHLLPHTSQKKANSAYFFGVMQYVVFNWT